MPWDAASRQVSLVMRQLPLFKDRAWGKGVAAAMAWGGVGAHDYASPQSREALPGESSLPSQEVFLLPIPSS